VYALYHDMGFHTDHVLTFRTPVGRNIPPERLVRFYQDVLDRVRGLHGVRTASAAYNLPGAGVGALNAVFADTGISDPKTAPRAAVNQVSGGFFAALDIPLLDGRTFEAQDRAGSAEVAILSAGLARRLFPGGDPVGRRVRIAGQPPDRWLSVVGVVGDVRPMLSQSPGPAIYRPFTQDPPGAIGFVIRTEGSPMELAPAVERAVWQILPGQPVTYVGTLAGDLDEQGFRERLSAIGLGWFAGFSLLLAAIGMYGLIGYVVKQSLREFGIRLAIGATTGDLVTLVVRRGAVLIASGLLLGTGAALLVTRVLKSVLYGVGTLGAPAFLAAAVSLAAIGLAACYVPARKAGAVDPMTVLRSE
jgi:predicted permease